MALDTEVIQSAQLLIQVNQFNAQMELERSKFLNEVAYQDKIYKLKDEELKVQKATLEAKAMADEAENRLKKAQAASAELKAREDMSKSILTDSLKRMPDDKNPYRGYSPDDLQSLYIELSKVDGQFMPKEERDVHNKTKGLVLGEYQNRMKAWNDELMSRNPGDDPMFEKPLKDMQRYSVWGNAVMNPELPFPVPGASSAPSGEGMRTAPLGKATMSVPGAAATVATTEELFKGYSDPEKAKTFVPDVTRAFKDMRAKGVSQEKVRVAAMNMINSASKVRGASVDFQKAIYTALEASEK
jgi:hypothetical protein